MELVSIDLHSIYSLPFKIDFTEFINCLVSDFEIDVINKEVDVNTIICCEICNQEMKIKFVKIQ